MPSPSFEGIPRFHPMPGKIAVQLLKEPTLGGLILPTDTSNVMGIVVALGGDEEDGDAYELDEGDVVMFSGTSGVKVGTDGLVDGSRRREEVRIFRTAEILCKVTWEKSDG